jgi:hypothetical protein
MSFLKRLFGGGGTQSHASASAPGDPAGLYYFIQPDNCDEVIRVRINRENDLTLKDDESGYWVHKTVRGSKCFHPVEVDLHFDRSKRLTDSQVKGGKLVDEAAYQAWQAAQHG